MKKQKRVLLVVVALFVCAAVGFAGGKQEEKPSDTAGAVKERTEVTVFGWLTTYAVPFSEVLKEKVEAKYPDIEIVYQEASYEESTIQYLLMAESGDAPDVSYTCLAKDAMLASIGALEDLHKWISKDIIDDLAPAAYKAGLHDGKLTSIIWDISPYALFTNANLAKAAGFSKPPRTIKEFEKLMYAVGGKTDAAGNKIWGTNIAGLTDLHVPFLLSPWLYNFGGDWFDENGKCVINSPEAVELLTWFKKMYDDGLFGPVPIDRETNRSLFMEGHLGVIGEGPWQRGIWRESSGQGEAFDKNWWLDTYPTRDGSPGKSLLWASCAAIMKDAEHKEEAAKVIEMWVSDPEVVLAYGKLNGGIPAVQSIQNLPEVQNDPYRKVFVDAIQAGGELPFAPYGDKIDEMSVVFANAFQNIMINDAPIKETLNEVAAELDRIASE